MTTRPWLDNPSRYGLISRGFHWGMAALFAWQFAGALLYLAIGDTALTRFVGGSHFALGFALFLIVLIRGTWGLLSFGRRPGARNRVATAGHAVIYVLMVVVPGVALLRQYGSGEPFSPFGIPVMPGPREKIAWMTVPGDLFHHWLAFALLALILGHTAIALVHRYVWKDDVLSRMA